MSRGTPRGRISGVLCPNCESRRTRTRSTGYSHDDDRVRRRVCADCSFAFLTMEYPLPKGISWGSMVPYAREHDRRKSKDGWRWHPGRRLWPRIRVLLDLTVLRVPIRGDRETADPKPTKTIEYRVVWRRKGWDRTRTRPHPNQLEAQQFVARLQAQRSSKPLLKAYIEQRAVDNWEEWVLTARIAAEQDVPGADLESGLPRVGGADASPSAPHPSA